MLRKTVLLAALASLSFAAPASAHRAWLLPSTTVLSDAGQGITVDAATSTEPFTPDHFPMATDDIRVWAPDGSMGKIENAARGRYRSTFDVMIDKPGTWRIGSVGERLSGTFEVNGETWMIGRRRGGFMRPPGASAPQPPGGEPAEGGRRRPAVDPGHVVDSAEDIPAGASDFDLTESQSRNEFFVTAGAPTESVFEPTGRGLEMVPLTHPADLVSSEPGRFRFLVDGKPAVGIDVTVVPGGQRFREAAHAQELKTGADGTVTVAWPVAGFYWLNADASDDSPADKRANRRRMSYTATLEVLAP